MVMATTNRRTAKSELFRHIVVRSTPRVPLSHREFAERYIKLATGPFKGEPFRIARQPFTGLLFDEFDSGNWPTIFVTGPSQSSKTLSGFVIPTLRDVVELHEDPLIAVPEADMASDKWDRDFMPTLRESSELSWLIPTKGPGSKGGRIKDRITLGNGVDIKIMTRGGADTAKAGYTASRIRVTEVAGFSKRAEESVEADPLRQIMARMRAFKRHERSLIVEGTVTVEEELPWRARGGDDDEVLISTRSRIVCPCPHCEAWICPEREHLVGWKGAESEQQVADRACFVCPECVQPISDDDRKISNADSRLVHFGQEVTSSGEVTGPLPPTTTLWFRWTAYNNLLLDAADTAIEEWKADQIEEGTVDRENADRALCQFNHAKPFTSSLADNEPLNPQVIRKRRGEWQRGLLPSDTARTVIGVDMGKFTAWWLALSIREGGQLHVPAYGAFDVCRSPNDDLSTRIVHSLQEFNEHIVEAGFPVEGSDGLQLPDGVIVDMGFMPDDVAEFVRSVSKGWQGRWKAARGRGRSVTNGGGYSHPKSVSISKPRVGTQWYAEWNHKRRIAELTFNADYWKLWVHDRLRSKPGRKGAMTLFRADSKNEHAKLSNHLASDQLTRKWDAKKGLLEAWVRTGDNHWLDCVVMAGVMLNYLGVNLRDIVEPVETEPVPSLNWYARMKHT